MNKESVICNNKQILTRILVMEVYLSIKYKIRFKDLTF